VFAAAWPRSLAAPQGAGTTPGCAPTRFEGATRRARSSRAVPRAGAGLIGWADRLRRDGGGCPLARRAVNGSVLRLLLVCTGGALGSGARYLVSTWAARVLGADFPRGTILVNATGSFVLAFLFALPGETLSVEARLFLGAGVMGGYTTYSSFNYETLALLERGAPALALANVLVTVVACLVAGLLGLAAGRVVGG
jgi:fluoride exporter